ncbi:arylamine N-acetyltransferase [Pusillimonas sp. TS35]|nr:arylamine N-acetyltransferase [Pusillimonas sp. TS35]
MHALPPHDVDVDAYFRRIGYTGTPAPSLATLRTLHALHAETIPFENLDPLLGRVVRLDLASIEAKLVAGSRGGYCYEHNLLFAHVLERLGFAPRRLAARVLWNQPEHAVTPRSHMLLLVPVDGKDYIVDTGFGGNTLTGPILLRDTARQETPHGAFRVLPRDDEDFLLEAFVQQEWRRLYAFDLARQLPIDYEAMSYYLCMHPLSHFRHALYAALAGSNGRLSLLNDRLTLVHPDGTVQREVIRDPSQALRVLETRFGIQVPDAAEFHAAWPHLRTPKQPDSGTR